MNDAIGALRDAERKVVVLRSVEADLQSSDTFQQRAAQEGVSRSQVIREAIVAFFKSDRAAAIDRQIVDGYTRKPQGGAYDDDEWGNLASVMAALTADQARSLPP